MTPYSSLSVLGRLRPDAQRGVYRWSRQNTGDIGGRGTEQNASGGWGAEGITLVVVGAAIPPVWLPPGAS